MFEVPSGWPERVDTISRSAPVFPLRDVFLFPGQLLPLHIFEPRYRQMIEDCLDGPGRIVIAAPREDEPPTSQGPRLPAVAGIGEIVRHHRLADGRFLIWILGLGRVRLEEASSDRLYRRVTYDVVEEVGPTRVEAGELLDPLQRAITDRIGDGVQLPGSVTTGQLADILGQCVPLPGALMAHIFAETQVTKRARMVLDAHEKFPGKKHG